MFLSICLREFKIYKKVSKNSLMRYETVAQLTNIFVFLGVTKDHLAQIDRQRAKTGKHTRMTHYTDTDELIIKLPTIEHETAHISLSDEVNHKLEGMGLARRSLWVVVARHTLGSAPLRREIQHTNLSADPREAFG
jgi:Fe2+ transport system protein FeoA